MKEKLVETIRNFTEGEMKELVELFSGSNVAVKILEKGVWAIKEDGEEWEINSAKQVADGLEQVLTQEEIEDHIQQARVNFANHA